MVFLLNWGELLVTSNSKVCSHTVYMTTVFGYMIFYRLTSRKKTEKCKEEIKGIIYSVFLLTNCLIPW